MTFFVAPTEPDLLKAIGTVSLITEKHGSDVLWLEPQLHGYVGVQRKTLPDLLGSMSDGRMTTEVAKMRDLKLAFLVVEGRISWSPDGKLIDRFRKYTRAQHRSLLRSFQQRGIYVEFSDDVADTVLLIREIASWAAKADHDSLDRRPKPSPDSWGSTTDQAWATHLLQSFEGIGFKQAKAIWDHYGNTLPLAWTTTPEEFMKVPGVGKKRVEALMKVIPCREEKV